MRTQPSHGQQRVFFLQCSKPRRAPVDTWPPTSSTSDGAFSWLQEFVCGHQTGQVLVQLLPTHLAEPLGPPLEPWTRDWEGTASTAFASQDSLQRSELGETAVHLPDMFTTAHTDAVRIVFLEVTATQTKRHESKWLQEPIEDTARHEHEAESTSKLQPSSRVVLGLSQRTQKAVEIGKGAEPSMVAGVVLTLPTSRKRVRQQTLKDRQE